MEVKQSQPEDDLYHSTRRLLTRLPTKVVLRVTLGLTVLALALNVALGHNLFLYGLETVAQLQNNYSYLGKFLNNIVTTLLDPILVTSFYALFLLSAKNKQKVVALLIYLLVNTYVCTVLKSMFQQGRPYWEIQSIDSLGWYCPMDWGNPSGHSWYSVIFYQPLIVEYIGLGYKAKYLIVPIFTVFLVPFSRLYLGAHNVNQVILGLLIGLSSLVAYRYHYERKLKKLIVDFKIKSNQSRTKQTLFKVILTHIFLFIFPLIVYSIRPQALLPTHSLTFIEQQCKKNPQSLRGLNNMMLMASAIINLAFGVLYGIFKSQRLSLFYLGDWKIQQKRKRRIAAKIFIDLMMLLLPLFMVYMYGLLKVKNALLQYFVVSISLTLSGYLYMKMSPILQVRFNIIKLLEGV